MRLSRAFHRLGPRPTILFDARDAGEMPPYRIKQELFFIARRHIRDGARRVVSDFDSFSLDEWDGDEILKFPHICRRAGAGCGGMMPTAAAVPR